MSKLVEDEVNPQKHDLRLPVSLRSTRAKRMNPLFPCAFFPLIMGLLFYWLLASGSYPAMPIRDSRHGLLRSFHQSHLLPSSKHIGSPSLYSTISLFLLVCILGLFLHRFRFHALESISLC